MPKPAHTPEEIAALREGAWNDALLFDSVVDGLRAYPARVFPDWAAETLRANARRLYALAMLIEQAGVSRRNLPKRDDAA